ncbi:MAG: hypothetical protein AAGC67_03020 [Myxococcota bacterium]
MATSKPLTGWWIQLGADPSAAPVLEAARARGLSTLVFDPDVDAPGARFATRLMTRPPDAREAIRADLRALARTEPILACATALRSADALRTVAALREDHGLAGPGVDRTELLVTRAAWKKGLADADVSTPVVALLASPLELDRFLGVHPTALLKPATGSRGSTGVSKVRIGDPRNRELFDEARLLSDSDLVRAEAFVSGDAYSIDGVVSAGRFRLLHLGREFSMRNLRGTLPTGTAWGSPGQGRRADSDPRWATSEALGQRVTDALGLDATFLHLGVLDDGEVDHVVDLRPHVGRAIDRALAFGGLSAAALSLDLALEGSVTLDADPGAITRGFAQRFFYASAAGRLEAPTRPDVARDAEAVASSADRPAGWRALPLSGERTRLEWDRALGDAVERPRCAEDRVARALVEAGDQNGAWMRANELDPDAVFRIRASRPTPTTTQRPPLWPMTPERD